MAKPKPAFQMYAAEFYADTAMLTQAELGALVRIMCQHWRGNQLLTKEAQEGAALGSITDRLVPHIERELARLDELRGEYDALSATRSEVGKLGGRPKAIANQKESKTKANGVGVRVGVRVGVEGEGRGEDEGNERAREPEIAEAVLWPTFDDWWTLYDKKTDRKKCEAKWNRLDHPTKTAIMEHTRLYVTQGRGSDPKYRRDPATYLNNENWNDDELTQRRISQGDNAGLDIATKARMAMEANAEHYRRQREHS